MASHANDRAPGTGSGGEERALTNPLHRALSLTYGPRQKAYGPPERNFQDIADGWTILLGRKREGLAPITAQEVALMMCWLKLCREANMHDPDNLVDIAGYVNNHHMIEETRHEDLDRGSGGAGSTSPSAAGGLGDGGPLHSEPTS